MDQAGDRVVQAGRALVAYGHSALPRAERPLADFVTQLIACDRRLPAYRQARRAEPAVAAASYGAPAQRPAATFACDA